MNKIMELKSMFCVDEHSVVNYSDPIWDEWETNAQNELLQCRIESDPIHIKTCVIVIYFN